MAEPILTGEQRAAVRAPGSAGIRAGAGSGKTAVLAHRFIELLEPHADGPPRVDEVGQILAITFTDKAAAEMRARIRTLVGETLATATGPDRLRWERIRRELLGAQISTIHAFCARIVRENPIEAGVDPRAALLEEQESRAYLDAIIEETLVARLRGGDPAARALLLARRRLQGGRDGGAVRLCAQFLERLGGSGRDATWLAAALARQEARAPAALAAMQDAVARIRSAVPAVLAGPGKGKGITALRQAWPDDEAFLRRFGPDAPLGDLARLTDVAKRLSKGGVDARDALHHTKDGIPSGTLAEEYGFLVSLPLARALTDLVGDLFTAVRERKRQDGVLTFDDLITEARGLLAHHPDVRARYAARFRAVLVDEFQDTDAVQADVIGHLAAAGASLFIVGDEKQSIYRFRGADVSVFQRVRQTLGPPLPLGTNFRSQPAILDFVNALAAHTLRRPAEAGEGAAHWTVFEDADRLVPKRAQEWPRPGVRLVSFAVADARKPFRVAEARELEARALAEVIADLHARTPAVRWGDVAVLFRSLNQVKAYEYALRRREIPYYVVKGRGFYQCQEVRDVASLLAAVADKRDGVALAAALRSPFFGVDDDTLMQLAWPPDAEKPRLAARFWAKDAHFDVLGNQGAALRRMRDLLVRLRRLRSRATIAELIEEALAATDFEAVCLTQFQGTQKVANVRKVIELARSMERRRYFGLRDFVRLVRELTERESLEPEAQLVGEQDDVVRLMTIHQAKGLEFPVVVLVDLARPAENETAPVVLDDELGILASAVTGAGGFPVRQARVLDWRAAERDRGRAERARLLYVACTRARDLLVLLEGRRSGSASYLRDGKGDAHVWAHQVWDVLGREAVAQFLDGTGAEAVLPLPGGGEVLLERAETYASRAPAAFARGPEPAEAPAGAAEAAAVARVVNFTPPPAAEVVTSPTALGDFARCPRQYWYRHVLGVAERGGGGGGRARLRGTAAHAVLETLALDAASDGEVERRLRATPEALRLRPADLRELEADLRRAVVALRAEAAGGLEMLGREVPFVLPLPAAGPTLFIEGRIDVLARRGGAVVVRDYKYAEASAAAAGAYETQLAAYRLAAAAGGAARVEAELVFLRRRTQVWPLPAFDPAAAEAALVRAGRELGAALASGEFPRRPPDPAVCEQLGCGYVARCWSGVTRTASRLPTGIAAS